MTLEDKVREGERLTLAVVGVERRHTATSGSFSFHPGLLWQASLLYFEARSASHRDLFVCRVRRKKYIAC